MNTDVDKCIKWLEKKCDVSFLTDKKLKEIVNLVLDWDATNKMSRTQAGLKQLEKEKKEKATREDYKEEIDKNGRMWYVMAHNSTQRDESRKLKQGDIIVYKGYKYSGTMIVKSFDYQSDFAARCYYGIEQYEDENGEMRTLMFCEGAPGVHAFSFATEEETKNFFDKIKNESYTDLLLHFKSNCTPDYIKEQYGKYLDDVEETWETRKITNFSL